MYIFTCICKRLSSDYYEKDFLITPNLKFCTPSPCIDKNELLSAKNYLEQAAASNLPEFLKALSKILVDTTNSAVARMAAGLQLKNHLTSKDEKISEQYQERWHQFPADTRELIKNNVSY